MSAHLRDQVAAYVDGQLGYSAREKALRHLADCAECRAAVDQQRWVKATVQSLPRAEPSADLLSSLTQVSVQPPPAIWPEPPRGRFPYGRFGRGGLLLAGFTSIAAGYLGVAYAVGGTATEQPDPVTPPVGRYATEFAGSEQPVLFSDPAMDAFSVIGDTREAERP